MVLSNEKIKQYLDQGESLKVTPVPERLEASGFEVHLDHTIYMLPKNKRFVYNSRRQSIADFWQQNGQAVDLRTMRIPEADVPESEWQSGILFEPGDFFLGQTRERIELPIDAKVVLRGDLTNVSRNARGGLMGHPGASKIRPGTNNPITVEVANLSQNVIWHVFDGMAIGQLEFQPLEGLLLPVEHSRFHQQVLAYGARSEDENGRR